MADTLCNVLGAGRDHELAAELRSELGEGVQGQAAGVVLLHGGVGQVLLPLLQLSRHVDAGDHGDHLLNRLSLEEVALAHDLRQGLREHADNVESGAFINSRTFGGAVQLGEQHFGADHQDLVEVPLDELGVHLHELGERLERRAPGLLVLFDRLHRGLQQNRERVLELLQKLLVRDGHQEADETAHAADAHVQTLRALSINK